MASLKSGAVLKKSTVVSTGNPIHLDIDPRNTLPKWFTLTPCDNSAIALRIHGGQSCSPAPINAMVSAV